MYVRAYEINNQTHFSFFCRLNGHRFPEKLKTQRVTPCFPVSLQFLTDLFTKEAAAEVAILRQRNGECWMNGNEWER